MFQSPVCFGVMILLAVCSESLFANDATTKERPGLSFRLAEPESADGLTKTVIPDGPTVYLHQESVLTNKDVTSVSFGRDESGRVEVTIQIEVAAAKRLAEATKSHVGKPMAVLLDGKLITAPVVRSEISASAKITGKFSNTELMRMFSALVLHSEPSEQAK